MLEARKMSALIAIFARPETIWVGNALHGIITIRKVSYCEKCPVVPRKGGQREALTRLGETLHK